MFNSIQKRFMWLGMFLLRCIIVPINKLVYFRKPERIPIVRNNLLLQSASSLAKMIRTRQVTSEKVVQTYISRIRDVNPLINGMVEDRFDSALQEARMIDILIHSGVKSQDDMERDMPFLGVPLSVKESIAVQGMSHTAGVYRLKGRRAKEDAVVVRLMKEAGAVPLLVTNTPELCMNWETYNMTTGRTNNPHDIRRTAGGSSGGEAAMLSSAASVIGLGSDVAGSARLPAFFTGVYGHKPTPGVVSLIGHYPTAVDKDWGRYFSICPMTRYAVDLVPLLRTLAGDNAAKLRLDEKIAMKDMKIYYMEDDAGSPASNQVHPEIICGMRSVVKHLEDKYGIKAQKVHFKNLSHSLEYAATFLAKIDGVSNVFQKTDENAEEWNSVFKELVKFHCCMSTSSYTSILYGIIKKMSDNMSEEKRKKLTEETINLHNEIKDVLGDDGVLLYPTFTDFAHHHYEVFCRFLNTMYMMVWNVLEMPVTQCPIGKGRNGLPMGIQLVAGPYNDRLTMALAHELESAFGGWLPPSNSDTTAK